MASSGTCAYCSDKLIYEPELGQTLCRSCGAVAEESGIVAEVSFGETAAGAAVVTGQNIRHDQTGPRFGRRRGVESESREQTLWNGKQAIKGLAHAMGLPESVSDSAGRWFQLALNDNFVQGRRSQYVIAACLYIACRMAKVQRMLIDFSEELHVNVFVLGNTYLRLVKSLNLGSKIPVIDPSLFINRFASLLDFGDEQQKVAQDATRLVKRFNGDWMDTGRRPAGICGACLLLAARMNNFRRSIQEIVQVVKIADVTVRKRLEEFRATPTSSLSVEDFRIVWLSDQADPPSFGKPNRKRKAGDNDDEAAAKVLATLPAKSKRVSISAAEDSVTDQFEALAGDENFDVLEEVSPNVTPNKGKGREIPVAETSAMDEVADLAIGQEIGTHLDSNIAVAIVNELDGRKQAEIDTLDGLDEEELDLYILDEAEVKIRERIWVVNNKDYLEAVAAKHMRREAGEDKPVKKRPRKNKKNKDSATAPNVTAAEAAQQVLAKKRFSKKLDPTVFNSLFEFDPALIATAASMAASRAATPAVAADDDAAEVGADDSDDGEGEEW